MMIMITNMKMMTKTMMMAMMIQVRAEVSERLDGLVSSVADLRAQFEGTLARVSTRWS